MEGPPEVTEVTLSDEGDDEREHWQGRMTFIFAAIGSAIGLWNVWRFPYIAYDNGGGAFLIPYIIALVTTGIPLMALEFGLGYRFFSGAPKAFGSIDRRFAWVGWLSILVGFVIVCYYTVILAWCLIYIIFAFSVSWGDSHGEIESFFFNDFLNISGGPTEAGGFRFIVLAALVILWFLIYMILSKGIKRVGKVVLITVPLPFILLGILFFRTITLPGAMDGIEYYLTPDASKLGDGNVWMAAYGQVFFSLSLAQGVMIVYASYLPKERAEINNNAIITSLADSGLSFFAGFAVFSVLGFVAHEGGPAIGSGASGPHLAFVTYPLAISELGAGAAIFGIIFFIMLLSLGIDSAFSMVEALSAGLVELGWPRERAVLLFCTLGFGVGLLFVTGGGFFWLNIVDHYAAGVGLVLVGLLEVLVIGHLMRPGELREFIDGHSEVKLGRWWEITIRYVTPIVLTVLILWTLKDGMEFSAETLSDEPPVEYPGWLVFVGGYGLLGLLIAIAMFLGWRYRRWA